MCNSPLHKDSMSNLLLVINLVSRASCRLSYWKHNATTFWIKNNCMLGIVQNNKACTVLLMITCTSQGYQYHKCSFDEQLGLPTPKKSSDH